MRGFRAKVAGAMGEAIEVILLRQWASYLELPVWLMDPGGSLIYYNEAAEPILGRTFEESGPIELSELSSLFLITDEDGTPLPTEEVPVGVALLRRVPTHRRIGIRALDGTSRLIDVTAFPVTGQGGRHLGAVAMFWEVDAP
jgi:PAS domain-containing protein